MISEKVKELEEELEKAKGLISWQAKEIERLKKKKDEYKECCMMVIPEKIYTHKARGNTTVKFQDGSSMTVKRKQGDKDCIETAIAYCILKQMLTPEDVRKLIKEREEH